MALASTPRTFVATVLYLARALAPRAFVSKCARVSRIDGSPQRRAHSIFSCARVSRSEGGYVSKYSSRLRAAHTGIKHSHDLHGLKVARFS
eukprot:7811642-Pyramimonas_sp.AAC.1